MPRRPGIQGDDAVLWMITTTVASRYGILPADIFQQTRRRAVVEPRQVVAAIAYSIYDMRGGWVALRLGFKNHSNVVHCLKVVRNMYESCKEFRGRLSDIIAAIGLPPDRLTAMIDNKTKFTITEQIKSMPHRAVTRRFTQRRIRMQRRRRDPATGRIVAKGGEKWVFFR